MSEVIKRLSNLGFSEEYISTKTQISLDLVKKILLGI